MSVKIFWLDTFNNGFASTQEKTVYKFSLMLLVLDGSTGWNSSIALRILCTLMLVFNKYASNRLFWALISVILLFSNALQWYSIDNHKALFMYWTFVLNCYFWLEKKESYIVLNARLLIGLVMFFAVFQKLANGFIEPGFLHGPFLFDGRFLMISHFFLAGIPMDDLTANKSNINIISQLPLGGSQSP